MGAKRVNAFLVHATVNDMEPLNEDWHLCCRFRFIIFLPVFCNNVTRRLRRNVAPLFYLLLQRERGGNPTWE